MSSLIKLVVAAGIITLLVVYGNHAISSWKTKRARKAQIEAVFGGEIFSMAIELPHGSENSKKNFSKLLVRLYARLDWFDVSVLANYADIHKPGDLPILTFLVRCKAEAAAVAKQEIKGIYRDATLIPYNSERALPEVMLEAVEAYWMEHYHEPEESTGQNGGEPYDANGNGVIGDGQIQMTSGGGIAGRLQARKAARA
jgi:hypothetical protein